MNPHVVAALMNAGDCWLIVAGTAKSAPSRSLLPPRNPRRRGNEVVGSGKSEILCRRMHCATAVQWAIVCADGCVLEPGSGNAIGGGVTVRPDCPALPAEPFWRLKTKPALTNSA